MKLADFSTVPSLDSSMSFSLFFSVCDLLAVGFFLGCGFEASSTNGLETFLQIVNNE